MNEKELISFFKLIGLRYKSHPWHGVDIGDDAPQYVNAFIEVVPTDTVKYEVDKTSGYLKIDRPQKFSNIIPALYGFIPQTYSDEKVAEYCNEKTGRTDIVGDHDPIDICVLTERTITHGDIFVGAKVLGGFRMVDNGEADDKLIATLRGDTLYKDWKTISDCPLTLINRLKHYFLTYKDLPGSGVKSEVEITDIFEADEAYEVIKRGRKDYKKKYGKLNKRMAEGLLRALELNSK